MKTIEKIRTKVDWPTTLIPFVIVLVLMIVFMLVPEQSKVFVDTVRGFLGVRYCSGIDDCVYARS